MIATFICWMPVHICQELCSSEHFYLETKLSVPYVFLDPSSLMFSQENLKYGLNQEALKQ